MDIIQYIVMRAQTQNKLLITYAIASEIAVYIRDNCIEINSNTLAFVTAKISRECI